MALFLSTFINKIDKKGRVSLPSQFRGAISDEEFQGFIAFRSHKHQAIECCTYSRMEKLSNSVDDLNLFSQEQEDFTATIFADSTKIPYDNDGRIVLAKQLVDFIQGESEIAFVGRGATFQIWHPKLFTEMQNEARKRIMETGTTLKIKQETK